MMYSNIGLSFRETVPLITYVWQLIQIFCHKKGLILPCWIRIQAAKRNRIRIKEAKRKRIRILNSKYWSPGSFSKVPGTYLSRVSVSLGWRRGSGWAWRAPPACAWSSSSEKRRCQTSADPDFSNWCGSGFWSRAGLRIRSDPENVHRIRIRILSVLWLCKVV